MNNETINLILDEYRLNKHSHRAINKKYNITCKEIYKLLNSDFDHFDIRFENKMLIAEHQFLKEVSSINKNHLKSRSSFGWIPNNIKDLGQYWDLWLEDGLFYKWLPTIFLKEKYKMLLWYKIFQSRHIKTRLNIKLIENDEQRKFIEHAINKAIEIEELTRRDDYSRYWSMFYRDQYEAIYSYNINKFVYSKSFAYKKITRKALNKLIEQLDDIEVRRNFVGNKDVSDKTKHEHLFYNFLTFEITDISSNKVIGIVGLQKLKGNINNLLYFTFEDYRNKGFTSLYVKEFLYLIFTGNFKSLKPTNYYFSFEESIFECDEVFANPFKRNFASNKILEKFTDNIDTEPNENDEFSKIIYKIKKEYFLNNCINDNSRH